MGSEEAFLKYFITENIYVIEAERAKEKQLDHSSVEEAKTAYHEPEKLKSITAETCVVLKNMEYCHDETLQKILTAIKIPTPDYVDHLDLQSGHKNYLIFGDFSDKAKYVIHESDGIRLVISDDIMKLKNDETLKRKLWNHLKEMFLK